MAYSWRMSTESTVTGDTVSDSTVSEDTAAEPQVTQETVVESTLVKPTGTEPPDPEPEDVRHDDGPPGGVSCELDGTTVPPGTRCNPFLYATPSDSTTTSVVVVSAESLPETGPSGALGIGFVGTAALIAGVALVRFARA